MKLLHTSDLHLGLVSRGESRQRDQERVLNEILGLCHQHEVDLLLITGDIFADRPERPPAEIARWLLERMTQHFRLGRAVFLLRGNHDPLALFSLMRVMAQEMAGGDRWPLVVADQPGIYAIPGKSLQVVALPYVSPSWLRQQPPSLETSPDGETPGLSGMLALALEQLYRAAVPGVPSIFASHVMVRGAHITEDIDVESGYHRDLWLEPARLPQFTSYNALGHIHLGQEVRGVGKPTWYAGAPDRIDIGERAYQPSVLIVTIPEHAGGSADVARVPLTTTTPFVSEDLVGREAVDQFCDSVPSPDPLGEVRVSGILTAERPSVDAQLRRSAPRIRVQWSLNTDVSLDPTSPDWIDYHNVLGTVTSYLDRAYATAPEKRARLQQAFNLIWGEPEAAGVQS